MNLFFHHAQANTFEEKITEGFAKNQNVKIHYAMMGKGPLIVMVHGFPSYWYMWRNVMEALSEKYTVVAIDQRGYNLSDKPKGIENYDMQILVDDVAAVIKHLKFDKAIFMGHDWGGNVGWAFSIAKSEMLEKLIILNFPHPNGMLRELKDNPDQLKNKNYAIAYRKKNAHKKLTAEGLASWVKDPEAKTKFVEAFKKSDFEAMLNYYKRNHFVKPFNPIPGKTKVPVLMIHGLKDTVSLPETLNGTWNWLENDFTLVTIPEAGHFVLQDSPELVIRSIKMWLAR